MVHLVACMTMDSPLDLGRDGSLWKTKVCRTPANHWIVQRRLRSMNGIFRVLEEFPERHTAVLVVSLLEIVTQKAQVDKARGIRIHSDRQLFQLSNTSWKGEDHGT